MVPKRNGGISMGITISYRTKPEDLTLTKEQKEECVELTKGMAKEAGFNFIEVQEDGYLCMTKTTDIKGKIIDWDAHFVDTNSHPQIRMHAIKQGAELTTRTGVVVHPPNTESFSMMFLKTKEGYMLEGNKCKTQPFSGEDPNINAMSHIWIISLLTLIKQNIIKEIYINDEGNFYISEEDREHWKKSYEEGEPWAEKYLDIESYKLENLEDAFATNLQLIETISEQLQDEFGAGNVETGMTIETRTVADENVKSQGVARDDQYLYRIFEQGKTILEEVSKTQRTITIPIELQKTNHEDCPECKSVMEGVYCTNTECGYYGDDDDANITRTDHDNESFTEAEMDFIKKNIRADYSLYYSEMLSFNEDGRLSSIERPLPSETEAEFEGYFCMACGAKNIPHPLASHIREAHPNINDEQEPEPENIPCKKCGNKENPLFPNHLCPDCWIPGETPTESKSDLIKLAEEFE